MHLNNTDTKHPLSARNATKDFSTRTQRHKISFQLLKKLKQKDYKFKACKDKNEFTTSLGNVVDPVSKQKVKGYS